MLGRLQFRGDASYAERVVTWADAINDDLEEHGQSRLAAETALRRAGPAPAPWFGRWAKAVLKCCGYKVLYRGQKPLGPGADFLSSLADATVRYRGATGMAASRALESDLRALDECPREFAARYDSETIPDISGRGDALHNEPIGAAGICFSEHLPVSAGYARGPGELLYVTLQRLEDAGPAFGCGYVWEGEWVALHCVPRSCILLSTAHRFPYCKPAARKQ